jgi:hypothetical protein
MAAGLVAVDELIRRRVAELRWEALVVAASVDL